MIPFAIVVIVFSAVNTGLVTLSLWPFPNSITIPVFTLVLSIFIVGFLMGGIVAWISGGTARRKARQNLSRAEAAERELRAVGNTLKQRELELQTARDNGSQTLPAERLGGN